MTRHASVLAAGHRAKIGVDKVTNILDWNLPRDTGPKLARAERWQNMKENVVVSGNLRPSQQHTALPLSPPMHLYRLQKLFS